MDHQRTLAGFVRLLEEEHNRTTDATELLSLHVEAEGSEEGEATRLSIAYLNGRMDVMSSFLGYLAEASGQSVPSLTAQQRLAADLKFAKVRQNLAVSKALLIK